MRYLLIGYDENGDAVGAYVLFAASAGIDVVKANALSMLHDARIKCVTCSVQVAPKADQPARTESAKLRAEPNAREGGVT